MYFALSLPGIFFQYLSEAFLAAFTALSTSAAFESATSESFFSVAGLIVSKYFPEEGFTNFPLMKDHIDHSILYGWHFQAQAHNPNPN